MAERVKIVECPRDAWQGLPLQIPTARKVAHLRKLITAGFKHIDAVSFVSPEAVPQMSDSERVLELLASPDDVEIIGIVVNRRGAERAIGTEAVLTLGYPHSVSAEFLRRNQHKEPEDSLRTMTEIAQLGQSNELDMVVYLSMAFGNPYGEALDLQSLTEACSAVAACGVRQISLADTAGVAETSQIAETFAAIKETLPDIEVGVHLHARRHDSAARIRAAWDAGCRRFDAALAGLGGCPFAQDTLVGNIATEVLLEELTRCGAALPELAPLNELVLESAEIGQAYGPLTA